MHYIIGHTVKDKITGFTGIVIARVEYISGCNQILVQPGCSENTKRPNSEWIDEQRCVLLPEPRVHLDNGDNPGCDRAAPKR